MFMKGTALRTFGALNPYNSPFGLWSFIPRKQLIAINLSAITV
jgi:hypothetical protein